MTVQHLIDLLNKVKDKSLPVETEGCDCYGDTASITVRPNKVCINRSSGYDGYENVESPQHTEPIIEKTNHRKCYER